MDADPHPDETIDADTGIGDVKPSAASVHTSQSESVALSGTDSGSDMLYLNPSASAINCRMKSSCISTILANAPVVSEDGDPVQTGEALIGGNSSRDDSSDIQNILSEVVSLRKCIMNGQT